MNTKNKTLKTIVTAVFIGLSFIWSIDSFAQYDLGFYSLRSVPQTNTSNPAFIPDYQYHFGAPAISSVYGGFGTNGARYNQIFKATAGDSIGINPSGILGNIKSSNNINAHSTQQWLNGGMKWKDFYFTASVSDITESNIIYSDKLVQLGLNGNADFIGETINLDPLAIKMIHYREYAVGAAWNFNDQLNFGAKAKMLFGKSAVNSEKMDFELTTIDDYYNLDVKTNFLINTSITANKYEEGDVSWSEYAFYGSNIGFGLDLGATYKLDELWSFSASVLDIGYIQFDRFLKTYKSETEFSYKGIDAMQFEGLEDNETSAKWETISDSLIDLFEIDESAEKFIVPLTTKIFLGADYKFSDIETISALARIDIIKGKIRPSFSASYYRQINDNFGVSGSYSIVNRSFFNLGLGVVARFDPVQVYIATDNIIGVIVPDKVRYTNFHIGINFIFPGTNKKSPMIDL